MAESQLICMDEEHVNVKIPESKPEFYYSEEQRAALEHLLRNGDGAFKLRLREDNVKDFLSAREVKWIRETFREYDDPDPDDDLRSEPHAPHSPRDSDSGVHSTYWPTLSDTEAPALELGWPTGGFYRGVTRVSVYSHPPKPNSPHIKEVVRRLIQDAHKTIAVVMDLLTDLLILQDLLDAASKRGVAVYLLLDETGLPHFLDMCNRLQISAQHLRNMRVRMVRGCGLALSFGKLPGSMCSKYMLVDGDKVMFGSYSFTWTSSRMNRNAITVMSGHVVDFFDSDFRELYAVSDKVDLYHEFHVPKPPRHTMPTLLLKAPPTATQPTLPASASRFQVSLGESKEVNLKVPAHKYHNPKYALVVGNTLGLTGSLQDLTRLREYARNNSESNMEKLLHTSRGAEEPSDRAAQEEMSESKEDVNKSSLFGSKKQRSSFRLFLKGRLPNQSPDLKTKNHNSTDVKTANHSQAKPDNHHKDSPTLTNHKKDSPTLTNHNKDFPTLTNHKKDSPTLTNHNKDSPTLTNHNKDSPTLTNHNQDSTKLTNHNKDSPKLTNHKKDSPTPTNHNQDSPTPTNHNQDSPTLTNKDSPKLTYHNKDPPKPVNHNKDSPTLTNHNQDSTTLTNHNKDPPKPVNHNKDPPKPVNHVKDTFQLCNHTKDSPTTAIHVKEVPPENSQVPNGKHTPPSPIQEKPETAVIDELDDSFVIIEKPNLMKFKSRKSSKLPQRSVSMQVISTGAEEGSKGQKRSQKKSCIQS